MNTIVTDNQECLKNTYEFVNLRALKFSIWYKNHIFQCMGKIFVWNFKAGTFPYIDCFNGPRLAAVGPSGGFVLMATIGQGFAMKDRLWLALQSAAK